MPWDAKDASRFTKKAKLPKARRQWSHVADSALMRGLSEGEAVREANGVVKERGMPKPSHKSRLLGGIHG